MTFGTFLKEKRIEVRLTLREFAKTIGSDPSNWSKVERGVIPPPLNEEFFTQIADVLKLDTEDRQKISDLASLARRELPADFDDEALLAKMPAFFRAVRGREYTDEDMDKLIEDIKKLQKP